MQSRDAQACRSIEDIFPTGRAVPGGGGTANCNYELRHATTESFPQVLPPLASKYGVQE